MQRGKLLHEMITILLPQFLVMEFSKTTNNSKKCRAYEWNHPSGKTAVKHCPVRFSGGVNLDSWSPVFPVKEYVKI